MFQFKQFSVDQSGCAMKINTDGVLLGAIATAANAETILDIGTGTGVIALMLAQKYHEAKIDAVEIDSLAAQTADLNFKSSPFATQLTAYPISFEAYFDQYPKRKYDLIISNPPFYINSLKSPGAQKTLAKHTNVDFFAQLIINVSAHLTASGCCWLILPLDTSAVVIKLAAESALFPKVIVNVHSFAYSAPHRVVICFTFENNTPEMNKLTIYEASGIYSDDYERLLQPYFLAL